MALEISEIGVRMAVGSASGHPEPSAGQPSSEPRPLPPDEMAALIRTCVREVLDVLRRREAR